MLANDIVREIALALSTRKATTERGTRQRRAGLPTPLTPLRAARYARPCPPPSAADAVRVAVAIALQSMRTRCLALRDAVGMIAADPGRHTFAAYQPAAATLSGTRDSATTSHQAAHELRAGEAADGRRSGRITCWNRTSRERLSSTTPT
jgi:hypothetical protein